MDNEHYMCSGYKVHFWLLLNENVGLTVRKKCAILNIRKLIIAVDCGKSLKLKVKSGRQALATVRISTPHWLGSNPKNFETKTKLRSADFNDWLTKRVVARFAA